MIVNVRMRAMSSSLVFVARAPPVLSCLEPHPKHKWAGMCYNFSVGFGYYFSAALFGRYINECWGPTEDIAKCLKHTIPSSIIT